MAENLGMSNVVEKSSDAVGPAGIVLAALFVSIFLMIIARTGDPLGSKSITNSLIKSQGKGPKDSNLN